MVIDIVLYNGEKEMFDLRYEILKDYVDKFYVIEFNKTFSGKEKRHKSPFNKRPKVEHMFCDESFYKQYLGFDIDPNFQIEYAQREGMKEILAFNENILVSDNDVVFCGDVDEIWWLSAKETVFLQPGIFKLEQIMYYYFLNNRWNRDWAGTFVGRWKDLKDKSWNTLRAGPGQRLDTPSSFPNLIKNGGWHFTNCMSLEGIRNKIESYSHQEYNTPEFKADLENKIKDNRDYYNITFPILIDEENWPEYLKANRSKYKHLCRDKS